MANTDVMRKRGAQQMEKINAKTVATFFSPPSYKIYELIYTSYCRYFFPIGRECKIFSNSVIVNVAFGIILLTKEMLSEFELVRVFVTAFWCHCHPYLHGISTNFLTMLPSQHKMNLFCQTFSELKYPNRLAAKKFIDRSNVNRWK